MQSVTYLCKIFNIIEDQQGTTMQVYITDDGYGSWDNQIMVYFPMETEYVNGDLVWICGTIQGSTTYHSQANWEISVPLINAEYLFPYNIGQKKNSLIDAGGGF